MYRFSFPGFAEREWVLPRDVQHDDPAYEALPWNLGCQDLRGWAFDPTLRNDLRALYEATFGRPLDEPAGAAFHVLVEPLVEAMRRGDLVAWVFRANAVQHPAQLGREAPRPKPSAKTKTWIELSLVAKGGGPIAHEPFRMILSDGSALPGSLDERGFARVENLEDGVCDITFPRIHAPEWGFVGGRATDPDDATIAAPPKTVVIRPGDSLARIVAEAGFRNWHTIREHANNAELVRHRRDPNLFVPGDRVFVPERLVGLARACSTGRHHAFETIEPRYSLRIKLELPEPCHVELELDGKTVLAETKAPGDRIDLPVDPLIRTGRLRLWPEDYDTRDATNALEMRLDVGALTAIESVHGAAGRLANLGFHRAALPVEELDPPTRAAVARFQDSLSMDVTADYDRGLVSALGKHHDHA